MPLGPYPNFAACVSAQKRKGKSDEAAHKICGWMEHHLKAHEMPQYFEAAKEAPEDIREDIIACVSHLIVMEMESDDTIALEKYVPPKSGDAPKEVKRILAEVYSKCRSMRSADTHENKTICSKIAWAAVEKAGWHKNEQGRWVKG